HALVNRAHFGELHGRVLPVVADSARLPLPTASADVVLSIEAISLFYDPEAFLDECARVLRPGGCVLISDGHNGANPAVRSHHEELWERLERGPMGRFGEHDVPEPMVARRERLIRDRFPGLAPALTSTLAERTSCMDRGQIMAAVRAHLAGGALPASPYRRGMCPREPEWGYCLDQLFDPRDLAARLTKRGFSARALPHYGGAANDLVNAANNILRAWPTFRWARGYRVVARKR
ncbi:MAG: class I SAM-dependent methyltransferase, partial [Candidatus Eisenbacteria bacterium]